MSDLVGNPEDRFSHNEAQLFLQMTNCVASCLLLVFLISQTYGTLSDYRCIWSCLHAWRGSPIDANNCKMCAADPPITYQMCYAACQHNKRSMELSIICDACFDAPTKFMPYMCRQACRDKWYYPNVAVCNICQETDILVSPEKYYPQ